MLRRLLGHFASARSSQRRAREQHAHLERAIAAENAGNLGAAREAYEQALAAAQAGPEVRLGYAGLLQRMNDPHAAQGQYELCLREHPDRAPAYVNYGVMALHRGEWKKALRLLEVAVSLAPGLSEARVSLALVLKHLGRDRAALEQCEAALRIDPGHAAALESLAALEHEMGEANPALAPLRTRAVSDGARIAMALALPHILESSAQIDAVRVQLAEDIARLRGEGLELRDPPPEVGITAFYLAYHGRNDRALQEAIAALHLEACPQLAWTAPHVGKARTGEPLRVGIASAYLYDHSIGRVTRGLIEKLDRRRFSVHAFGFHAPFDAISNAIAASADAWTLLPRDLAAAREAVAQHTLDVLLYPDVGMDPLTYFMTFARLAPVQCTTWGHPVTTGVPAMDYFVSTDYFEPDDGQDHYSERLVRLRDVAMPGYYYPPAKTPPASRAALGLDETRRVYLCPQALFKFHPDFDATLADILRRDGGGEVVIVYDEQADAFRRPRLEARLRRAAPDVAGRIVFVPRTPGREGYLQRLQAADVVLDTMHYCGGNTSLEAVSAGAPVVTLPSGLQRGRHTYGFFRKMRFTDTIAATPEEYVDLAVRIATDRDYRTHVIETQAGRAGALYEDSSAVEQIGGFFEHALAAAGR